MRKRKRKWLSLVSAFLLVLGLASVTEMTAKAETISSIALTVDLPEAGETKADCGALSGVGSNYTVEVYKWLKGSYETVAEVQAAWNNEEKLVGDSEVFAEKEAYTVVFQATTSTAESNCFQGAGMSLTVNGENALFVTQKTVSSGMQKDNVYFAYSYTIPKTISSIAVTVDLPEAGEKKADCGTVNYVGSDYTVGVSKWLKGSYATAAEVQTALADPAKELTASDIFAENGSYTVVFQAKTSLEASNRFQGAGMSLTVNAKNALFVSQNTDTEEDNVYFAYSYTIPGEVIDYKLEIAGVSVKSDNLIINSSDVAAINSGSLTFDPNTYTLTMDSVKVNSYSAGGTFIYYRGTAPLTIQVKGINLLTFDTTAVSCAILSYGPLRITSDSHGKLVFNGLAKIGVGLRDGLSLDGSVTLELDINAYDLCYGIKSDGPGSMTVEDDVNLIVATGTDPEAVSPQSLGINAAFIMNGGSVEISTKGKNSKGLIGSIVINGGVLTVACEEKAISGSVTCAYPCAAPKITAGANFSGVGAETYDKWIYDLYDRKYIKIEKGQTKTLINNLSLKTLSKPVTGENPYNANDVFVNKDNINYYDCNWMVWDEDAGVWDNWYDDESSVSDSPFREGKKYALRYYVVPKSGYAFPADLTVTHNGKTVPDYDPAKPDASYRKVSASGGSLTIMISQKDMPESIKFPVTSAKITLSNYQHGKNVENVTIALEAVGAHLYDDGEYSWYLAVDGNGDGEPDGFAPDGPLAVETDYFLAVPIEADAGYRVNSLKQETVVLSDGTTPAYFFPGEEDFQAVVYKLPRLSHGQPEIWKYDENKHWKECTVESCGEVLDGTQAAHTAGDWIIDIPATATTNGTKHKECTVCHYVMDTGFLPATGTPVVHEHSFGTEWKSDGISHWHECSCGEKKDVAAHTLTTAVTPATLTKAGKTETFCSVCKKATATKTIAAVKTVKLSQSVYAYDGKTKSPKLTVKDSTGKTVPSKYYTVKKAAGRKAVGKYTYKLTFKGNYKGTKTLSFTINPKGTELVSIKADSKGFTVKWKKQTTQTTGYEIRYATNAKMDKAKTVKITGNKTTSKKVTKLAAKKKYYVQIRTCKKVGSKAYYSGWSKIKQVTTK